MRNKAIAILTLLTVGLAGVGGWLMLGEAPGQHHWIKQTDAAGKTYWTCTMHPQVRQDHPGNCPVCGMPLVQKAEASESPSPAAAPAGVAASSPPVAKPLYWYDPMKPEVHFDKPGKSPFMDMQLVPKYAEGANASAAIQVAPQMVQSLGMRTAMVERGGGGGETRAVGVVAIDEHRIVAIEARAAGWVEALNVRAVGDPVHRGQAVAGIYAPDLFAAQQELALAAHGGDEALLSASKQRLSLLGVPGSQIDAIARGGSPSRRVAIVAPTDGIVSELNVREGAQAAPGMPLMRVADLSRVWVEVQVPESQAAQLHPGDKVQLAAAALPGKSLSGAIDYVYPDLDATTRTARARVGLDNPGLALRPGMYVDVVLGDASTSGNEALTVPTEAVIRTGTRTVVIVADGNGRFHPVAVTLGPEQGERTVILSGIEEGQQVVTSGQFLIDSEASLRGAYERMAPP